MKKKWLLSLAIGVVILLFLIVNLVVFLQPIDKSKTVKTSFDVRYGDGFKVIAERLEEEGLIKSRSWFKIYSLITGSAHLFKPGSYELNPSMSGVQIAKALTSGPQDIKVIVYEGETLVDIDRKLAEAKVLDLGELKKFNDSQSKSLEGFLFPDTYKFTQHSKVDDVVKKFLDNFKNKVGDHAGDDDYEDLIIASIIEKEALRSQDRLVVSGVIHKRLDMGMALQIDASVVYAKCKGAFLSCDDKTRVLSSQDLKLKNPYNTYLYPGLPPTPISNPGKESIMAALNPQKSKYLYYISDPKTGRIIFSQTLDEHNQNRFKYLR